MTRIKAYCSTIGALFSVVSFIYGEVPLIFRQLKWVRKWSGHSAVFIRFRLEFNG